jgi:hypothetical protein
MSYIALGDESQRFIDGGMNYLLGTVLVNENDLSDLEYTLNYLNQFKDFKIHWHTLRDKEKMVIVEQIKNAFHECIYVQVTISDKKKAERARRKCLEQMLWQLDTKIINEMRVKELILESRMPNQNKLDMKMYDYMLATGVISGQMKMRIEKPLDYRALWLADIVLGIIGDYLTGKNTKNFEAVKGRVIISKAL